MVQKWFNKIPDPNVFYDDVEALIRTTGRTLGVTTKGLTYPDLNFLVGISNLSVARGREYSQAPTQDTCSSTHPTQYNFTSAETMMFMLGIISLSWLSINIKKKTEDGHCHNPAHTDSPRKCSTGSSFHKELYDDLFVAISNIVAKLQASPPNVITLQESTSEDQKK